ncbi:MAG: hypothetical protein QOG77_3247 [Solirubrobacteraceae bacterium]|nr:hypothetical protein [Solirubrobacteraceae bacterium]
MKGVGVSARGGLIGHMDRYLQALVRRDPAGLPVSPGVRFTENGQELDLGTGLWGTASSVPDHDYAHVVDEERSTVSWIGVVDEHGRPSVVFIRLTVEDGLITEVETVVRRPHERLYDPASMREPRAIVFEEIPVEQRSSAEELMRAGDLYFDGLEQSVGSIIPVTDDCTRFENGTRTVRVEDVSHLAGLASAKVFPLGVREQIDTGYFGYIYAVRDRRFVSVDETRGLVVMMVVFDHSARSQTVEMKGVGEVELPAYHQVPNSVLIAELFKVRGGLIEHIEAVLEFVPYGARTGWEKGLR